MSEFSGDSKSAVLSALDYTVISIYFVIILGLSLYSARPKQIPSQNPDSEADLNDSEANQNTSADSYFLADRSISWFGVGCSLFMSNIGSEHFVALAGSGASSGLVVSCFEWMASLFVGIILGYVFTPLLLRLRIKTLPELLTRRFSPACGAIVAFNTVLGAIATKICVTLYSGALILTVLLDWNPTKALIFLLGITALYTLIGGLSAVVLTEIVQSFVLLAGAIPLAILALNQVNGWNSVVNYYQLEQISYKLHLFFRNQEPHPPNDIDPFPWTGILFGLPIMQLWYWCTDQVVVQRVLAAKSVNHAKGGCLLTGFAKISVPFLMVFPGVIARVLYENVRQNPNHAYVILLSNLLPNGLLGLLIAAMLAALMSSLASTFTSTSAILVYDFYIKFLRKNASDREQIWMGKFVICLLTLIGLAWVPLVSQVSDELYVYIQSMISYIAPPTAVVYLAAVTMKWITPTAALLTLILGGFLGILRMTAELICAFLEFPALSQPWNAFVYSNFLHFAIFETAFSFFVMFGTSFITESKSKTELDAFYNVNQNRNAKDSGNVRDNERESVRNEDIIRIRGTGGNQSQILNGNVGSESNETGIPRRLWDSMWKIDVDLVLDSFAIILVALVTSTMAHFA
eukprot:CAMPEP_0182441910 /NCGR_PEP_ID=MMETSP1172-20130603/896_1 /TAXON_ID=708627 /ORGANISM="Timspurckia oligopyrenoides, Strain CCMP3278" /LENGTH=631 /DNA_ID=CAMNT_0024636503 /DNA_START=47 /DNA_END=1942 /DNA_ORIENTATION=+